jgi:hypothetical protein
MTDTPLQHEPVALPGRPFGPTARSVAGYSLLTAMMFLSPLFVFLPTALFHYGIRIGRRAAWLILFLGAGVGIAIGVASAKQVGTGAGDARMEYACLAAELLALALPAMLVLPRVQRNEPFGRVLMAAVIPAGFGLAITEIGSRMLMSFSPYAQRLALEMDTNRAVVAAYETAGYPASTVTLARRLLDIRIEVLPANFLIEVIVVFVLSLIMFGRLGALRDFRARDKKPAVSPSISPSIRSYLFRNLSLPEWLLFAFVLSGLAPLLTGMSQKVAANVLAVVGFLYLLQGLAIFRSLLVAVGASGIGALFGYLFMLFMTVTWMGSIAGLFDSFFDFRKFRRKDDSHESHTD